MARREYSESFPVRLALERAWEVMADTQHLNQLFFGLSASEARRLLAQGGVKLNGETVDGGSLDVPASGLKGAILQVGKRRFARLVSGR